MSNQAKQRPIETLRDGQLKAAIWQNEGENGVFYNVTLARTYRTPDGDLRDTDGFSGSQLLRLARLADQAYGQIAELRKASSADTGNEDAA